MITGGSWMILIDSGGNHRRSDGFLVETPQFNLGTQIYRWMVDFRENPNLING
jgi:hypothetical protein